MITESRSVENIVNYSLFFRDHSNTTGRFASLCESERQGENQGPGSQRISRFATYPFSHGLAPQTELLIF